MKYPLLIGIFLLGGASEAKSISGAQTAWNCELLPAQQVSEVQCKNGDQRRSFYTYALSNADHWYVLRNFLFQKVPDIDSTSLSGKTSAERARELAERNNGSLVYDLSKGMWIDSELNVVDSSLFEWQDINPTYLTNFSQLSDSRILIHTLTDIPGGTGASWAFVLSSDGRHVMSFDSSMGNAAPDYLSKDGKYFYNTVGSGFNLHLWSARDGKYLGYFALTAQQFNFLASEGDGLVKLETGKNNLLLVCGLKKCLNFNLKQLKKVWPDASYR